MDELLGFGWMVINGFRVIYDGWLLFMFFICYFSNVKSNINSRRNRKRFEFKYYVSLINFLWIVCLIDFIDLKYWIFDFLGCFCWGLLIVYLNVLGCMKDGEIKGRIGFICIVGSCVFIDSIFKFGRWFVVCIVLEFDWFVECIIKLGFYFG